MTIPSADAYVDFYTAPVQAMLAKKGGFWQATRAVFDARLKDTLLGKMVLDVTCGEGHLGRHLLQFGPERVTGIDTSTALLEHAREHAGPYGSQLRSLHGDAQTLSRIEGANVNVAVSNLALMDIPDHLRVFTAVRRVLRPGGVFVFSMMHPCFEAPFDERGQVLMEPDQPERRAAYTIRRYATEGRWFAGKEGMRSRVGAPPHTEHHRVQSAGSPSRT